MIRHHAFLVIRRGSPTTCADRSSSRADHGRHETALRSAWRPAAPPRRPVLLINPRSGGGRATRAALAEHARQQGIEAVVLEPGRDLTTVIREAVAAAPTRGHGRRRRVPGRGRGRRLQARAPVRLRSSRHANHFAQDLGIDRRDVIRALRAFTDGVERRIDVGLVNGRLFLNNVSLGLYGDAVQQAAYREAKLRTLLATATRWSPRRRRPPRCKSSTTRRSARPSGRRAGVENPYALEPPPVAGTRPRLDSARLGTPVLDAPGSRRHAPARAWSAPAFEVRAATPVHAGIDGEAVDLDALVRFQIGRRPCACGSRRAIRLSPSGRCRAAAPTCASRSRQRTPRLARRRPVRWREGARKRAEWTVERLAPPIPVAGSAVRGLVPRQPLFERLSAAGPGGVVLVCASAGSGKTVLLRSWVDAEGLAERVAWVSVERGERDAQRFWLSVIDARPARSTAAAERGRARRRRSRRGGGRAAAV